MLPCEIGVLSKSLESLQKLSTVSNVDWRLISLNLVQNSFPVKVAELISSDPFVEQGILIPIKGMFDDLHKAATTVESIPPLIPRTSVLILFFSQ
jgi:hypothetical protein